MPLIPSILLISAVLSGANPVAQRAVFEEDIPTAPEPTGELSSVRSPGLLPIPQNQSPQPQRDITQPLAPPGKIAAKSPLGNLPTASLPTMLAGLGAAIGLFLIVAWCMRRSAPHGSRLLPRDVIEVLGRAPLAERGQMHLLRLGSKLVLVSVSQSGVETLSEVDDPEEVERLTGLCYQSNPRGSHVTFRQMSPEIPSRARTHGRDRFDFAQFDGIGQSDAEAGNDR